jgi:hypothetical protein
MRPWRRLRGKAAAALRGGALDGAHTKSGGWRQGASGGGVERARRVRVEALGAGVRVETEGRESEGDSGRGREAPRAQSRG